MDSLRIVEQIHAAGTRFVLAVTGGGSEAIARLFTVPGASKSMLLATVPYAEPALIEWLGARPDSFCSARTARAMAMVAYQKAQSLDPGGRKLAGVACTASLASNRTKHGPHRLHIAVQTAESTTSLSVDLEKGSRSRAEEQRIVADCILNAMAAACGLSDSIAIDLLPGDSIDRAEHNAPADWQDLLAGRLKCVLVGDAAGSLCALFPGAFNPLHQGHRRMCEIAERLLQAPVAFEISITNVDKAPLDFIEIEDRVKQMAGERPLWLTRAPTFVEKASLFPNTVFLIGVDTLVRIAEPRYYDGNPDQMLAAIETIARAGCRFLVFGRQSDGAFRRLVDLNLPSSLAGLCQEVPETEFREDVSSTELRAKNKPGQPAT